MARTYNGRFPSPPEPKGGGKWIAIGCLLIPFWSVPVVGIVASICCFVKGGKKSAEKRMYNRFHEFCAIIGIRQRIPIRELGRAADMDKSEIRSYLQKMIARGYFGSEAYLDVSRDELVLPPMPGQRVEKPSSGWKEAVFDLLNALRSDHLKAVYPQGRPAEQKYSQPREAAPRPEEKAAPEAEKGPERPKTETRQPKNYMGELERTLNELHALNEKIQDEGVSQRIDHIGMLTAGIFRAVIGKPEREQDVRKFMNYYLPTTLKLLKSYDMMEKQNFQSENIIASRKKIENVLDMLIGAFEKQLDRLFTNDALDIATDIDVLETMMAGDGLSDKGRMRMTL